MPSPPRPLSMAVSRATAPWVVLLLAGCEGSSSTTLGPDPVGRCTEDQSVVLAPGQDLRVSGRSARTLCLGGTPGADYLLVPQFLSSERGARIDVVLEGEGTAAPLAAVRVDEGSERSLATPPGKGPQPIILPLTGEPRPDPTERFHTALRIREQRTLGPRIRPEAPGEPPSVAGAALGPASSGVPPTVGTLLELNTQAQEACTNARMRTGEVMAVSESAIVVADTARPLGGFTPADFQHLAAVYDTLVAPVVHRHFGTPTDLDGNGRVILFFTPEVNRLTPAGSTRSVGGFFFARDLFPRTSTPRLQACATSNVAEVLYLLVPDPAGSINGNIRERGAVLRTTPATLGHELQHLVNAARRIHTLALPANQAFEEVWLNEGLSHAAEELLFFEASGLSAGQNVDLPALQQAGNRAIDAVNTFHVANLQRLRLFLLRPETHSPMDSVDNLEARGAAQNLLRYVADRRGGEDAVLYRSLVDGPQVGWANLSARVGGDPVLRQWLADWGVALYADERVEGAGGNFQLRSWNHPSLFAALRLESFPHRTRPLVSGTPQSFTLHAGGTAWVRFRTTEPTPTRIIVTAGPGAIPNEFHVTLLRIR